MARQDANAAFRAHLLPLRRQRRLYRRPLRPLRGRPGIGRCRVAAFFDSLKDERARRRQERQRRVVEAARICQHANGELVAALDGDWGEVEKTVGDKIKAKAQAKGVEISDADVQQATRDSVRALMLIRAYRMRGHFHANLDPLGLEPRRERSRSSIRAPTASPKPTRPQDLPRQCARARIRDHPRDPRDPAAHLLPDARRRVHAHLRSGAEGLDPGAHRGRRQGDHLHPRGQARDPQQAGRGRRLREVLRRQVHRHQALRPRRRRVADPGAGADHQARRRARREGDRPRHGASRPAQRAVAGDGQAAPRHLPRVQGRLGGARRRRRLGRREVPPRRLVGPRVRRQQGASVADRQSVASRDRQSGGARQGARQAGPARRDAARTAPW